MKSVQRSEQTKEKAKRKAVKQLSTFPLLSLSSLTAATCFVATFDLTFGADYRQTLAEFTLLKEYKQTPQL